MPFAQQRRGYDLYQRTLSYLGLEDTLRVWDGLTGYAGKLIGIGRFQANWQDILQILMGLVLPLA